MRVLEKFSIKFEILAISACGMVGFLLFFLFTVQSGANIKQRLSEACLEAGQGTEHFSKLSDLQEFASQLESAASRFRV